MDANKITLAEQLGTLPHISGLRHKARRLGLPTLDDLANEAVARGCYHYAPRFDHGIMSRASERDLTNCELAIALLTTANRGDPQIVRIGAMLVGAEGNDPRELARLAVWERCECVVRYIARCGLRYEPESWFWHDLLAALPPGPLPKEGAMPHHTRFVSDPGLIAPGTFGKPTWLRPIAPRAASHAA